VPRRVTYEELERAITKLEKESRKRELAEKALQENIRRLEVAYEQSIVYAKQLNEQVTERKRAEKALCQSQGAVRTQIRNLEELDTALKVLLRQREKDKGALERKVVANVRQLVVPYIEALKKTRLNPKQSTYVDTLQRHVESIVSPFLQTLSSKYSQLTPKEVQVATLIKEGKTTKEMAELFNVSTRAIEFHRDNIRTKLGLKNKKINLRTTLLSIR
jgi:DNA-binding CsgD family transcriptional regulator